MKLKIEPIFIKIDVEGFDHKVIKGMLKSIKKFRPIILVEMNKENFNEIYEMLKNITYRINLFLKVTHLKEFQKKK